MTNKKSDIFVFAHWNDMDEARLMGILSAHQGKGRKAFSFRYDTEWLGREKQLFLDPEISWHSGEQFPNGKENFGVFIDSMPDTWGRTLMKRRAAQEIKEAGKRARSLYDVDFLLGVNDVGRMGALRFKLEKDGAFLSNDQSYPTPPWSSIRELQHGISLIESAKDNKEVRKWLDILLAPGSSLGGARPKANVVDEKGNLWIAKFPSKNDTVDKAAWEFHCYKLALGAGIEMAESKIQKVSGKHNTFFTKRFDRNKEKRIHFSSAMTMTGNNEEILRTHSASYLDIAEFIQFNEPNNTRELHQLWRRLVFNIAVSNTDDHLRNHGFLLQPDGWQLSPAYDINPSVDKEGLALNIDTENNSLDIELATSVGKYFQLNDQQMKKIIKDVNDSVKNWKTIAGKIGISRAEQGLMENAFRLFT